MLKAIPTLVQLPDDQVSRPPAPKHLSNQEQNLWVEIVERMPAGWFSRENLPVLESYVAQHRSCRMLEACLRAIKIDAKQIHEQGDEFYRLVKAQELANRQLCALATKLRLTQQSNYDTMAAAR